MSLVLALVGDEASSASLHDILEAFDHVVVEVGDAAALTATAPTRAFELVLIDIEIAGQDSTAAIGQVHAASTDLRIIAITAYPKSDAARRALEAGAHSLMLKPFEIGRILHLLSESK